MAEQITGRPVGQIFKLNDWIEGRRADGMRVEARESGWVIVPHDGRPQIATCPCCDKVFNTEQSAALIADAVYPIHPEDSLWDSDPPGRL